ncbi:MAG: lysine--tRNA ligase, partial [Candidatus Wolfebacteria bacterium]|nr:lysine--tRNA ligase [Candidatus Wolfebacteria bacterium]
MLDEIISERKRKLKNLEEAGFYPYPESVKRTHSIKELLDDFESLSQGNKEIFACGRITGMRGQGSIVFYDIEDESGKIQGVLKEDNLPDYFNLFSANLDIGDFIEAGGTVFETKRGEKSIEIKSLRPIAKSLRAAPTKWYGLEDTETRLRQRYLDSLLRPEVKELFRKKNIFWKTFRDFLSKKGFLEVETSVLEATPGGAEAEPFKTHHNALDTDFYLRISLEIALKKMMVGGFEKIFEIGRIFRNEGIDAEHLQDYTELEFYWAYADYKNLMKLVEKMYKAAIKNVSGGLKTEWRGQEIDWSKKWPKVDYFKIFKEKTGIDLKKATDEALYEKAIDEGLRPEEFAGRGRLIDMLFKKARIEMIQPCILLDPPVEVEPLAKRKANDSKKVCRFQVVACGTELGKGFSEANDPIDQRERFLNQMKLREKGDKEAQMLDEDFLEALEYGAPPMAGV